MQALRYLEEAVQMCSIERYIWHSFPKVMGRSSAHCAPGIVPGVVDKTSAYLPRVYILVERDWINISK